MVCARWIQRSAVTVWILTAFASVNVSVMAQSIGSGGLSGIKEFRSGGTFIVPDNVSTILVELYGAGGGGGGTVTDGYGGCFGGEGAFSRSVIQVTPQATLDIVVGKGGGAGADGDPATNGGDGGNSHVSFDGSTLVIAYGGKGGQSGSHLTVVPGGFACTAAPGGGRDPSAMISHGGANGGGYGYQLVGFPITGFPSKNLVSSAGYPESAGGDGYVLLLW